MMNFSDFKNDFSIIVVDDNDDNIYTLRRSLNRDGYMNVLTAHNGAEALEIIKNNKVDLVLLDIMMPGMSGIEVLHELKPKIVSRELIVLMISSSDTLENLTQCILAGADDFLPKPYNPAILKARIGSSLEKMWYLHKEKLFHKQIDLEHSKFLEVLNAVFPASIVDEITKTHTVKPKNISQVAIMFSDIVSFTHYTEHNPPEIVLKHLETFIHICEATAAKYHIEKIKMIGDAFMATAGMLEKTENNIVACVQWASEVISLLQKTPPYWQIRVGIDIGDVICGIVGNRGYLFDVWGACVNTSARIQAIAEPNTIYMSEHAWSLVSHLLKGELVGDFKLKGIEPAVKIYKVELLNPETFSKLNKNKKISVI